MMPKDAFMTPNNMKKRIEDLEQSKEYLINELSALAQAHEKLKQEFENHLKRQGE